MSTHLITITIFDYAGKKLYFSKINKNSKNTLRPIHFQTYSRLYINYIKYFYTCLYYVDGTKIEFQKVIFSGKEAVEKYSNSIRTHLAHLEKSKLQKFRDM